MKKRGFTLIEIIISISLIAVIGTISIVSIVSLKKTKIENLLESNSEILNTALEVYLEKHPEITNNVNTNFKGAIVTLKVLKDEGLIDIKGLSSSAYENNYYFLSNSVLADGSTSVSDANKECDNNILSVQTVSTWDLKNLDKSKIIYICPTSESGNGSTTSGLVNVKNYVAKGENPNNYVMFEVNSNLNESWASWASENTSLWRIMSINDGEIKLVYSQPVKTNNSYNYKSGSSAVYSCRENDWQTNYRAHNPENNGTEYCPVSTSCYGGFKNGNETINGFTYATYLKYSSSTIWTSSEIMSEYSKTDFRKEPNDCYSAKKEPLINNIVDDYKKMIVESDYIYNSENKEKVSLYLGFVTKDDYSNSLDNNSKTYLDANAYVYNFEKYYNAVPIKNFNISGNNWYSGCGFRSNVSPSHTCNGYSSYEIDARFRFYILEGIEYYPVVTLNKNVKILKNDENCIGGYGSISCPYKLECENCSNGLTGE